MPATTVVRHLLVGTPKVVVPPAATTYFGSSGGSNTVATVNALNPQIVRTYQPGQLSAALGVSPKRAVFHSSKPGQIMGTRNTTPGSAYMNAVNATLSEIAGIPDTAPNGIQHRVAVHHEPENDNPAWPTPGLWAQAQVNFMLDVVNKFNVGRQHKVLGCGIIMGVTGTSGDPRGFHTADWFTAGAIAALDEICVDNYNSNQFTAHATFCANHGNKAWSVPEHGYSVSSNGTDSQIQARMQNDVNLVAGLVNPPSTVVWFNANHNELTITSGTNNVGQGPLPLSKKFWHDTCSGTPVGSSGGGIPGVDATGATDVTAAVQAYVNAQPDGSIVDFGGGIYRIEGGLKLSQRNNMTLKNGTFIANFVDPAGTIDADTAVFQMSNGTWTHSTQYRSRYHVWLSQCTNVILDSITVRGPSQQPAVSAAGNPPRPFNGASFGYRADLEAQHAFQWTGCINCTAQDCVDTYIFGDGLTINAFNEGHEFNATTVPSDGVHITRHHSEYNGRQGLTVANANNVSYDGFIGGSQRSLIDLEPETSGDVDPGNGITGQVNNHINIGPVSAGWHLNNMINIAGGGDNFDVNFHDFTAAALPAADNVHSPADGSVGFSSGLGFPAHAGGPRRQGPFSMRNIGPFTTGIGHNPLYGGQGGIAQFLRVDGVTIDNYSVTGTPARDMIAVSLSDCTGVTATTLNCANGFDLAWNMTDATTPVNVTGASLTANVATLTVPSGHGLVKGANVTINLSDDRYDDSSGASLTAVTATTVTYDLISADIAFAAVTGSVNPGKFYPYDDGWTPPAGAVAWDGFNQGGPTNRIITADSGQTWELLAQTTRLAAALSGNGTVHQAQSVSKTACTVPTGVSDCTVTITTTVVDPAKGSGPCFRATDSSNLWWFDNLTGKLNRVVAGVTTAIVTTTAGASGDVIKVLLSGSSITVKRNGATLTTQTDSFNSTAVKHGFFIDGSLVAELDNFSVA